MSEQARPAGLPWRSAEQRQSALTDRQRELRDYLHANPGKDINELAAALGVRRTAANFHARRLIRRGQVVTLRRGRHLLHFPAEMAAAERELIALIRRQSIQAVVHAVRADPSTLWKEVSRRTGYSSRSVRRAVSALTRGGLMALKRAASHPRFVSLDPRLDNWVEAPRPNDDGRDPAQKDEGHLMAETVTAGGPTGSTARSPPPSRIFPYRKGFRGW